MYPVIQLYGAQYTQLHICFVNVFPGISIRVMHEEEKRLGGLLVTDHLYIDLAIPTAFLNVINLKLSTFSFS